jgi:hypothetical protein
MTRAAAIVAGLALIVAIGVALYIAFIATNTSVRCDANGCVTSHPRVIEDHFARGLVLVFLPSLVPLSLLVLMHFQGPKELEWALAVSFLLVCLITFFSFGILYMPVALLSLLAAALDRGSKRPQPA